MNYLVLEVLKEMYKDGFRCIHTTTNNKEFIIELKNFDNEEAETLKTSNLYEISKIKDYLQQIEDLKKSKGREH